MSRFRTIALAGLVAAAFAQSAAAVTIWDEGTDGDLSTDPAAPTSVTVAIGTNSVIGSTVGSEAGPDRDIFTFTVPDGAALTQLLLTSFVSDDDLAFLALQAGPVITDPGSADDLLGWLHPSAAFVGADILDDIGQGAGAIGFVSERTGLRFDVRRINAITGADGPFARPGVSRLSFWRATAGLTIRY